MRNVGDSVKDGLVLPLRRELGTFLCSFFRTLSARSLGRPERLAHGPARDPVKTEGAVLTGNVSFGPEGVTREGVGVNSGEGNQKRERNRADSNATNQLLRKTELPAEQTID